jgi:hypothetical protein
MRSIKIPFFRIWYSSAFVIILLLTFGLTLISPGDIIYQQIRASKIRDIFSVAGVYLVTALIGLFIWAARIYANRVALKDIPKKHVLIEKNEVPRKVRKLIEKRWRWTEFVAWDGRPRYVGDEVDEVGEHRGRRGLFHHHHHRHEHHHHLHHGKHGKNSTIIPLHTAMQAWGIIAHPGWSPPGDSETTEGQGVQYATVIIELPNLLEAKAVALAPPIPTTFEDEEALPDPRVVTLLQRPAGVSLRKYVAYLESVGVLFPTGQVQEFVHQYEDARFSTQPIPTTQFNALMKTFSSVLALMTLDIPQITSLAGDINLESDLSTRYTTDSENPSINRPSLESDLGGSVRRYIPSLAADSQSTLSHYSSVIIHSPRLSFSDT